MDVPQRGLPVTIITGFLGSGKTTLLNHILSNQNDMHTAVLVNEFGEISIDSELIVSSEEDLIELNNGCLCCTIRGDVAESVLRLMERADARDKPIDYLVVETTGLADPLPVALTFLGPELRDMTRLDSIVTVVDATNFAPDLFDSEVADSQISYGDVLVLNKTDLVDDTELKKLEQRIRTMKEGARILRSVNAEVPLELLLDTALFDSTSLPDEDTTAEAHGHDHHSHDDHGHDGHSHHDHDDHSHDGHGHDGHSHDGHSHDGHSHDGHGHEHHSHNHHDHDHHSHDHAGHLEQDGFSSIAFESDRTLSLDRFQSFLNDLPDTIFRAKGILWFDESPERYVFHLSGKRYTINGEPWPDDKARKNQLVVIGQHLDKNRLLKRLEGCVSQPKTKPAGFGVKR